MTTAIIGVGNIGSTVARHLVGGGESVVLAAKDESRGEVLAKELGPLARAASVEDAIAGADTVVLALWLDQMRELISQQAARLADKVVVDPSNPIAFDEKGQMTRTLPDDQSAGSVVAASLPSGAHYVKAFGTLSADTLASVANREPKRAVLFYAAADADAATRSLEVISEFSSTAPSHWPKQRQPTRTSRVAKRSDGSCSSREQSDLRRDRHHRGKAASQ